MARTGTKGKKTEAKVEDDDFWSEEDDAVDEGIEEEEADELDQKKLVFMKIKDLKLGMENVNVEAEVDFVGTVMGKEYGDEPFAIGFVKDSSGEIKITFWGDDLRLAKKGRKVRIIKGFVSEFRGQVQLNAHRQRGMEFL